MTHSFHVCMQSVIEMDRRDEQSGQMEEIHQNLLSAYTQTNSKASAKKHNDKTEVVLDATEKGDLSHA